MIEGCNTHLTFIEITEVRNMENLKLCVCVGGGGGGKYWQNHTRRRDENGCLDSEEMSLDFFL